MSDHERLPQGSVTHWSRADWLAGRIQCSECDARLSSLDPQQRVRDDAFGAVAVCPRCKRTNEIRFVGSLHRRVAVAEAAVARLVLARPRLAQDFAAALEAFRADDAPPRGYAPAGPEHFLASAREDIERASRSDEEQANPAIGDAKAKLESAHVQVHGAERT